MINKGGKENNKNSGKNVKVKPRGINNETNVTIYNPIKNLKVKPRGKHNKTNVTIYNPTDTVYKTDTVKVPVVKKDTVYLPSPKQSPKPSPKPSPNPSPKPIKELPYPKRTQPINEPDNTRVDMSKTKSKAEYNSDKIKKEKTLKDFFPSNINMSGTSMGSYNKPMMKGSGLEMKCGCQVGKHMGGRGVAMMGKKSYGK